MFSVSVPRDLNLLKTACVVAVFHQFVLLFVSISVHHTLSHGKYVGVKIGICMFCIVKLDNYSYDALSMK